jgi:hypothetical protein
MGNLMELRMSERELWTALHRVILWVLNKGARAKLCKWQALLLSVHHLVQMGVARGVGYANNHLLGKIFEIYCENPLDRKKSLKLTVKIRNF